jgi:hypothetical protein
VKKGKETGKKWAKQGTWENMVNRVSRCAARRRKSPKITEKRRKSPGSVLFCSVLFCSVLKAKDKNKTLSPLIPLPLLVNLFSSGGG